MMVKNNENLKLEKNNNNSFIVESNESKLTLKLTDEDSKASENSIAEERANWGNRLEFLLACVGYSVGLGNVW